MDTNSNAAGSGVLVDHVVFDTNGARIGKVTDVIYDERASLEEPQLVVVNPGRLRPSHYVPMVGVRRTDGGDLQIPFTEERVAQSPKARRDHALTRPEIEDIKHYYGLN